MEGQCFLKPKASDKALLKTLPPVEVIEEPDDGQVSTLVVDSDDEADVHIPVSTPTPVPTTVFVAPQVQEELVQEDTVEEIKPALKKKVIRKKTDA
jgi:hypothetical protein